MSDRQDEKTISRNSNITLGLGISAIGAAVIATWWLSGQLKDIKHQLTVIKVQQEASLDNRWRKQDMHAWTSEFQRLNPFLTVPNPASEGLLPFPKPASTSENTPRGGE